MGEHIATRQDIARLWARAAFGATPADFAAWEGKPYADAVGHLLEVPPLDQRLPADEWRRELGEYGLQAAQKWWLARMQSTQFPLEERMTLFWHDHFATAWAQPYPDPAMLVEQNQVLRRHALGSFRDLAAAMTIDCAMLYWLNGIQNYKAKPNENFARELFELFTLGKFPQVYTETDIRQAARALTGWTTDPLTRIVRFAPERHDPGEKVIFGRTITDLGDKEYLALVDLALSQPVSARFVAYKLVQSLAYVPRTGDVFQDPDPLIDRVANALYADGAWSIKGAVKELLLSDEFRYGDVGRGRQVIRQPIEQVVAICKALGVNADSDQALGLLNRMGQLPLQPPNVGGWPVGKDWLSPVTTLARYDWGVACYDLWVGAFAPFRPALPASSDLASWASMLGLAGITDNTRATLERYLTSRPAPELEAERQAGVLILLTSSPDWMVI